MQSDRLWNPMQKCLLLRLDYLVEGIHIAKFSP